MDGSSFSFPGVPSTASSERGSLAVDVGMVMHLVRIPYNDPVYGAMTTVGQ